MKTINAAVSSERELEMAVGGLDPTTIMTPPEWHPSGPVCVWNVDLNDPEYIAGIQIQMQAREPEFPVDPC